MLLIPPPIYGATTLLVMWLLHKHFPIHCTTASWPVTAGLVVAAGGLVMEVVAVLSFRKLKTTINPLRPDNTTTLATKGIYTLSRNPMYLGMAIILTGTALMLRCLTPLMMPAIFCFVVTVMQILPEEKILREKFGDDYERYSETVGRWI